MIKAFWKRLRLKQEMFLTCGVVLIFMTAILSVTIYHFSNLMMTNITETSAENLMMQLLLNFEKEIEQVEDSVYIRYGTSDYTPSQIESVGNRARLDLETYYDHIMWNLLYPFSYVSAVMIVDNNGDFHCLQKIETEGIVLQDTFQENDADKLASLYGGCVWESYNQQHMIMKRTLYDPRTTEKVGYLTAAIKTTKFLSLFQHNEMNEQQYVLLCENDEIAFSSSDMVDVSYFEKESFEKDENIPHVTVRPFNNTNYYVTQKMSQNGHWKIIHLINYEMMRAPSIALLQIILLVGVLSLFLALLLANGCFNVLVSDLQKLLQSTKMVSDGNLNAAVHIQGNNEIAELANQFNQMLQQIHFLMESIRVKEHEKTQAEIKGMEFHYNALQSQLNPHFLYNTLESINSLAKLKQQQEISNVICVLGRLLRVAVDNQIKMVPLRDELNFIEDYASIYRITKRIEVIVSMNIEPELYDMLIPKLLLQPIVENSIQHGFDQTTKMGFIEIDAFVENSDVYLSVADNGRGMKTENVVNEQPLSKQEAHFHVGLESVSQRLKLLYGKCCDISIVSEIGAGTVITLKIPLNRGGSSCDIES